MKQILQKFSLIIALIFSTSSAFANQFHLFEKTPKNKMRPMAIDRPSKSDAAKTLNSGRFMIESSFVEYIGDKNKGEKKSETSIASSLTFKAGVTSNQELQILFDSYKNQRIKNAENLDERDGFGDLTLRIKHNFFGNDSGNYALTVIPFLRIPTAKNGVSGNNDKEFGAALPLEISLSKDSSLTLQTNFSFLKQDEKSGNSYGAITTYSKNLSAKISSFVELYFYKTNFSQAKWMNSLDFGLSYEVNDDLVIDAAANFGISQYADDVQILSGIAYRF